MISVSSRGIYRVGHVQEFSPECVSQCCRAGARKNIPLDYVTVLLYLEELVWVAWRMANEREGVVRRMRGAAILQRCKEQVEAAGT